MAIPHAGRRMADRNVTGPARIGTTVQRTLHDSALLQIGHIAVRPCTSACGDLEAAERHVLALPLTGVFAKHDGPRQRFVATPSHALLISAGQPYRLSFPGGIGDTCLALRFKSPALARLLPESLDGEGFPVDRFAPQTLLPPALMLERSRLVRALGAGDMDPLDAEERAVRLLDATLRLAQRPQPAAAAGRRVDPSRRRLRAVQIVIEAIAAEPQRKWTLDALADLAHVSPGHLAHAFRAEAGITVFGYVLRSRLALALEAVLDSDTSLIDVALDAGFASHSHFTARFRALFGHTPQALKRGTSTRSVRQMRRIATAPMPVAA